jgi:hypothetical protein
MKNEILVGVIYPLITYEMGRFLTTVLLPMYAPVPQKSLRSGIEHRLLHGSIFQNFPSIGSRLKNLP